MTKQFRHHILNCAAVLAIAPVQAHAQSANPQAANASQSSGTEKEEIVVTGTRIRQDGYDAPVPSSVLGAADILAQKPNNLADLVNTMPAVAGTNFTPAQSSGNISSALAGMSVLDLRGLGPSRSLILIDGRRTPGSSFNGFVDIGTIPQNLVERVEIVTGGASAQYGSDAVGGVANFILNTKFEGLKLGATTSITTYGEGPTYRFSATAGHSFMDDRLHVLLDVDYIRQKGIERINRPWNNHGYAWFYNPAYTATNGQPQYLVGSGIGVTRTAGGLIDSGPLKGTYFLGDGVTGQFNYGVTSSVSAPLMIGGDWQLSREAVDGTAWPQPDDERIGVFNRVAFDITPDVTLFGQFSWNRYEGRSFLSTYPSDMTIAGDNAYLLTQYPQVAAAMQANELNSITVRNWNPGLLGLGSDMGRQVFRYLAGAEGRLSLFDRPWTWEVYYQKGVTKTREETRGAWNSARKALASDAVVSNGQIVCRSTLADPTNGCVPLDTLGTGPGPSAAALAYIYGPEQPWRRQTIEQDVVSASMSGQLFDLPGGPAAIAFGVDWRKDRVRSRVGATSSTGWLAGNYKPNFGEISVKEGFVEVALPLFTGFNLDAAGRYTDYSISGSVQTWKVGAAYSPIPDIRFRGSYSHDIRAPNMQELFQNAQAVTTQVILPPNSPSPGVHFPVFATTSGNPNLQPETANTWSAGIVATPSFLPGFSASFDYYNIILSGRIGGVGIQQTVDFCYGGFSQLCSNLIFSGNQLTTLLLQPVNFASQHLTGFDIEASYGTALSAISATLPGRFRIHATASHYIKNVIDNRVFPVDWAGVINDGAWTGPAQPSWIYRVSASYVLDPLTVNLVARGFSDGVYGNNFVECTSGCPTSTGQHPTINNNRIKGSMYFDGSISTKIPGPGDETQLSFIVDNILNKAPTLVGIEPFANTMGLPQTIRPLYDTLGRVFRLSITTTF